MYKKILIPTDGSARSQKAIHEGITLAKTLGAAVVGFHSIEPFSVTMFGSPVYSDVLPPQRYAEISERLARDYLAEIRKAATEAKVPYEEHYSENDTAAAGIIKAAEEAHCDLIIMGSHGRSTLASAVLGSVTLKVLSHCQLPVLVCRS